MFVIILFSKIALDVLKALDNDGGRDVMRFALSISAVTASLVAKLLEKSKSVFAEAPNTIVEYLFTDMPCELTISLAVFFIFVKTASPLGDVALIANKISIGGDAEIREFKFNNNTKNISIHLHT